MDNVPPHDSNDTSSGADSKLRRQAELAFLRKADIEPDLTRSMSPEEMQRTLHELQVHQIELEMQNEELRRAQAEVEAGRARYFDLYDLAPVGYITLDENGVILESNYSAAALLGVSRRRLVKQPITRFICAEDQDIYYLQCRRLLETSHPQVTELRMTGRNSKQFWARLEATIVRHDGGACEFRIILTDTTERRRAEESLRDSLEFSSSLLTFMQDGFSVLDANGVAIDVNPALCRMTGFSSEELIGASPPHPYWPPEEYERIQVALNKTLRDRAATYELIFMRANGERFPVTVSPFTVRNRNGEIVNFAATVKDITERKRVEEELKRSEAFQRDILNSLPAHIAVLDKAGKILEVNEPWLEFARANGNPLVEKVGDGANYFEVCVPACEEGDAYATAAVAGIKEVLAGKRNRFSLEYPCDGPEQPRWFSMEVMQPLGRATGAIIAHTDISERKFAEEALAHEQNLLRTLVELLPSVVFVKDLESRFLLANRACARCMGADSPDELIGKTDADFYPPEAAAEMRRDELEVLKGEPLVDRETCKLPPGGSKQVLLVTKVPLRAADGEIIGLVGAGFDITARKQAEEALRDAAQKLRLHFEQTPMAVIEWDINFRVAQWNPAAQTIFGYTREEALGQHFSFIVPELSRPMVDGLWQVLIKKTGGEQSTNSNVSKDGTRILCDWYNTPLIDEHGAVAGFASIVMDITESTEALEMLAWEKSALELIGSISPLHDVLDRLMLNLEKQLPGAICSVLLLNEDGIHLQHGAAPSLPDAYNHAIDGLPIGATHGSCGTAAYTRRQVIVEDVTTDPLWADYREVALEHGLRACWSTPICDSGGRVLGTFAIYYRTPRRPAPAELALIERAVHVVLIAIKRKQAEEEIRSLNAGLEKRVEERTRQLQEVNASLAEFKAALDEHALVSITDSQGVITYANDKFCAISQYSLEELIGEDHRIVNSGYHPTAYFTELWQTVMSGNPWKGEMKNRAKDGSFYWVDTTIVPFLDRSGKPAQFMAIRTDITKRKLAEEALRMTGERLRLATEVAAIGVWERDIKSQTLSWDRRMFEIYGLPENPEGEAAYQDWRARLLPEDLEEQETRLAHTIATCGRDQREFHIIRASDHAVRVIQAAEMVIMGADGQAARMVGINRDITERKRAEEEISKLNEDLQNRAAELIAANKELEAFSYSVSHDLRAPLRAVDGFSRMVLEDYADKLDEDGQRKLGVIRNESQRMGRLIDDLLAFSRLGRQPIEPVEIDMRAQAQSVFDELAARDPGRKLRLDLHPLPTARGSEALVRQVWVNLISNAIKFTKERDPGEIEIGSREGENGERIYYVKDNGAGFDMRHSNKLFGVFQRLHKQEEFSGTGVGLALVQRIVHRHGGSIWAESEMDRGAAFYFTLPNQSA